MNEQGEISHLFECINDDGDIYYGDEFIPVMIGPIEPMVQGPHLPPLQGPTKPYRSFDLFRSDDLDWRSEREFNQVVEDFFNIDEFGLVSTT